MLIVILVNYCQYLTTIIARKLIIEFISSSQDQPTYDWDPTASWEQQNSWSQPTVVQHTTQYSQPSSQQYQVEQQYNIETNNTKSVINKSKPIPPPPPPTRPPPPQQQSSLFISETSFPSWDD